MFYLFNHSHAVRASLAVGPPSVSTRGKALEYDVHVKAQHPHPQHPPPIPQPTIQRQESQQGPPQAPWGHMPAYGPELAYEWGWAPPPKVYVKRAYRNDKEWVEIPICQHRRRTGFKVRGGAWRGGPGRGRQAMLFRAGTYDHLNTYTPTPNNHHKNGNKLFSCWRTSRRCFPRRPTPSRTTPPRGPTSRYARAHASELTCEERWRPCHANTARVNPSSDRSHRIPLFHDRPSNRPTTPFPTPTTAAGQHLPAAHRGPRGEVRLQGRQLRR